MNLKLFQNEKLKDKTRKLRREQEIAAVASGPGPGAEGCHHSRRPEREARWLRGFGLPAGSEARTAAWSCPSGRLQKYG